MISCLSIKNCREGHKRCRAYRTKRSSAKRIMENGAGYSERIRKEIGERYAQIEEKGQKIQKESLAEAELDDEIRNLQASPTDAFITMGAAQA